MRDTFWACTTNALTAFLRPVLKPPWSSDSLSLDAAPASRTWTKSQPFQKLQTSTISKVVERLSLEAAPLTQKLTVQEKFEDVQKLKFNFFLGVRPGALTACRSTPPRPRAPEPKVNHFKSCQSRRRPPAAPHISEPVNPGTKTKRLNAKA